MRLLDRLRYPVELADRVKAAGERRRRVGKEQFQYGNRFFQPSYANGAGIKRDSRLLVLARQPSRTDPELKASTAEDVQRRRLFGEHSGMPEVIIENECRQPDLGGTGSHELQDQQRAYPVPKWSETPKVE
jgi:hypothetical protein